jgi:hypothetical protein
MPQIVYLACPQDPCHFSESRSRDIGIVSRVAFAHNSDAEFCRTSVHSGSERTLGFPHKMLNLKKPLVTSRSQASAPFHAEPGFSDMIFRHNVKVYYRYHDLTAQLRANLIQIQWLLRVPTRFLKAFDGVKQTTRRCAPINRMCQA